MLCKVWYLQGMQIVDSAPALQSGKGHHIVQAKECNPVKSALALQSGKRHHTVPHLTLTEFKVCEQWSCAAER